MNLTSEELRDLAKEIGARGIKFADLKDGHYEMLAYDELLAVVAALVKLANETKP